MPPPGPDGLYKGPLFDAHLHIKDDVVSLFGTAEALRHYLEKDQILWAIAFFLVRYDSPPLGAVSAPVFSGAGDRVVPLLTPANHIRLAEGRFSEPVLQSHLQPQGFFQGVGEITLYAPELQTVTFESPQMQTVFRVVNEMKGIVMIHPSGDPPNRGRKMSLAEIEPSIRTYSNVIFLFHGGIDAFDLILPLMSRYPNVYFSWDANRIFVGAGWTKTMSRSEESAERFVADVHRLGIEQMLAVSLGDALARFQKHPDRVMWGTDRNLRWHFDDRANDLIIEVSRRFIARLPTELQEAYAFRNAHRVFGRYLTAGP